MPNREYSTLLPLTCGEESGLPGVPAVGCVATLTISGPSLPSFSCAILATTKAVYVTGPDLYLLEGHGTQQLVNHLVWQLPSVTEVATGACTEEGSSVSSSSSVDQDTPALLSSQARCFSLTAFVDSSEQSTPDAVSIVVAWKDSTDTHHVSLIYLDSLVQLLSNKKSHKSVVIDLLPLNPRERVFRLFHDDRFTSDPERRKIVLVSTLQSGSFSHHKKEEEKPFFNRTGVTKMDKMNNVEEDYDSPRNHPTTKEGNAISGTGGIRSAKEKRRQNSLRYIVFENSKERSTIASDDRQWRHFIRRVNGTSQAISSGAEVGPVSLSIGEATEQDIVPWLWHFTTPWVVSSLSVQPVVPGVEHTDGFVRAAVGTAEGRLFMLRDATHTLAHRLSGPLVDLIFVSTKATPAPPSHRVGVLDERLHQAHDHLTYPGDHAALLVLDSIGRVLALRRINKEESIIPQLVEDVCQVAQLNVDVHEEIKQLRVENVAPSERSGKLFDMSTLLHFFKPSQKPKEVVKEVDSGVLQNNSSLYTSIYTPTTSGERGDAIYAGNLLSRGLLAGASVPFSGNRHPDSYPCEVVVSTMGQAVVSIVFDTDERYRFAISGFLVTPMPMYHVGFIDFFHDGREQVIMASMHSVIVAQCAYDSALLKERANTMIRLLEKLKKVKKG